MRAFRAGSLNHTRAAAAFMALLVSVLWFAGCGSHRAAEKFVSVPVQVADSATMQPIPGATVHAFCMGDTPYATNVYHTDVHGIARVTFYDGLAVVAVRIEKDGYQTASLAITRTNPVVSLSKIQ